MKKLNEKKIETNMEHLLDQKAEEEKEKLQELLAAAFGEKKAKRLVKKVQKIKAQNPHVKYNFFFNEDGTKVMAQRKLDKQPINLLKKEN